MTSLLDERYFLVLSLTQVEVSYSLISPYLNMNLLKLSFLCCVFSTSTSTLLSDLSAWYSAQHKEDLFSLTKLILYCSSAVRQSMKITSAIHFRIPVSRFSMLKKKSQERKSSTRPDVLLYLLFTLLVVSWDIESNPGPGSQDKVTIYPCGVCSNPVTWEQDAICCDACDVWSHKMCVGMSASFFTHFASSDVSWICPQPTCNQPNYSSIILNTPEVSSSNNPYSVLADSMRNMNNRSNSEATPISPVSLIVSENFSILHSDSLTTHPVGSPQATSSSKTPSVKPPRRPYKKDSFKISILNCQSINNKILEFHTFLDSTDPDVVLGTESWLKAGTMNCEVFPDTYNVFRKDWNPEVKANGGGVFILVKKLYVASEIKLDTKCELLFVDLKLKDPKYVKIGCLYRPPWTNEEYIEDLQKVLGEIDPQRRNNVWLGGDFNVPNVDWSDVMCSPNSSNTKLADRLIEVTNNHSLAQIVDLPPRKDNILDLFFTTNPSLINRTITVPPLTPSANHDIVFIDVNTRTSIPKQTPPTKIPL